MFTVHHLILTIITILIVAPTLYPEIGSIAPYKLPLPRSLLNSIRPFQSASTSTATSPIAMAWLCTGRNNTELITNLASAGLIHSDRVRRAMIGVCSHKALSLT